MIEWVDKSDRGTRFFAGESRDSERMSAVEAVRAMFVFMCQSILGKGNAVNFDVLLFEANCDTGRLISGASTREAWADNRVDGCGIRVQDLQDYWYDLLDARVAANDFAQSIKGKVCEVARMFADLIDSSLNELRSKAGENGFTFVVFGSTPGETVLTESFR